MVLYPAALLLILSFVASMAAQVGLTSIYRAQANEFSKWAAGADPDDIVAFELIRPMNLPRYRTAGVLQSLALIWMGAGWIFLLNAVMIMATP